MIILVNYIFTLGAHDAHMLNVLGICDVMSVWSCFLQCVLFGGSHMSGICIGHMYWAYVCMAHIIIV